MLSNGEPHTSPKKQRRGNSVIEEKRKLGSYDRALAGGSLTNAGRDSSPCRLSPLRGWGSCASVFRPHMRIPRLSQLRAGEKDKQAELCQSPHCCIGLLPTPSERISRVPSQQDSCFSSHESLNLALPCQVHFFPFSFHVSFWVTRLKTRFYDQLAY